MLRNTQNLLNLACLLFLDKTLIIEFYTTIELGAMQNDIPEHSKFAESSMPSFSCSVLD